MERIKLNLTKGYSFSTTIAIRITDLNYGGHVGNDAFLSLIHEARQQFLKSFGYTELQFAGVSLIMADAAVEYKTELNYGDVVEIFVAATGFDRLGFDLHYILELNTDGKKILAGKAKTGMLCYNYQLKKMMPVPQEAVEKMSDR
jgi:acyl-CoA thioester hydrolase